MNFTGIRVLPPLLAILFLAGCAPATETPAVDFTPCEEPRPQMCTMQYAPVCAVLGNQERRQYSNGCSACADSAVTGFFPGTCDGSER